MPSAPASTASPSRRAGSSSRCGSAAAARASRRWEPDGAATVNERYYMACLDLRGRRCVVVGGGAVALEKAHGLLACGAAVTVVAPEVVPQFHDLEVVWRPRT